VQKERKLEKESFKLSKYFDHLETEGAALVTSYNKIFKIEVKSIFSKNIFKPTRIYV
jgi:hypothetical protein